MLYLPAYRVLRGRTQDRPPEKPVAQIGNGSWVRSPRDHKKLVDAIIAGVPTEQVKHRTIKLDTRRKDLERRLSASPAPGSLQIHPGMARDYPARIDQLIAGLPDPERMDEAKEGRCGR